MSQWIDDLATRDAVPVIARGGWPPDAARQLQAAVVEALYTDRARAARLTEASERFAEAEGSDLASALASRSRGHISYLEGDYARAVQSYERAAELLERANETAELGRTLSSGIQSLAYLGQYDRARQWVSRAEALFLASGDLLRLARLDSNAGNMLFRQDQPKEAVARYERALEGFLEAGEQKDIAAVLSNLAVCHTSLGNFAESLGYYRRAREHCEKHGLAPLAAQADYNIAYLYFQRGEYAEARRLYQLSRERCRQSGDAYHEALCDLDESELDLELNLTAEGEALAIRAAEAFERLGMKYEQAKALLNLAVAANQRGGREASDRALRRARRLFSQEGNPVWIALTDQLRAVLAFHGLRFAAAERLSRSAWNVLRRTMIPGRAAHSRLLLARLWLRAGYADRARAVSLEAVAALGEETSVTIRFHASLVGAEIHETQGRWQEALESYEEARACVDELRGRVHTEELRISVLEDKLTVYESLVAMHLDSPAATRPGAVDRALLLAEQAKSRSLADRLMADPEFGEGSQGTRIESLRKELDWLYRQVEIAALVDRAGLGGDRVKALRGQARTVEMELLSARRERSGLVATGHRVESVERLQEVLDTGSVLLDYFEARGVMYAFVAGRNFLEAVRLGPVTPAKQALKLLQFQLGKFRLRGAADPEAGAARHHLSELHSLLIAPLEKWIGPFRHLVIAPHRQLHGLPFGALDSGSGPLAERFLITVTPSATVLAECLRRPRTATANPLVMAVPDPKAPRILEEGRAVADLLPGSALLAEDAATVEALRQLAPGRRILHLAAHGKFRRDNPLFSSIELADGSLSLFDLQHMNLPVGLLSSSACSSGSSVQAGGDELLGLMRGFLAAGARSLLLSLWDIDDVSAKDFMRTFYGCVVSGVSLPESLRAAMREVRERYPHPYHWAPFILVGDPANPLLP